MGLRGNLPPFMRSSAVKQKQNVSLFVSAARVAANRIHAVLRILYRRLEFCWKIYSGLP